METMEIDLVFQGSTQRRWGVVQDTTQDAQDKHKGNLRENKTATVDTGNECDKSDEAE